VRNDRAVHLLQGQSFIKLAKQSFNSGKLLSSSTNIEIADEHIHVKHTTFTVKFGASDGT
jgi:hypothetical protein